jgi:hypothetical protein
MNDINAKARATASWDNLMAGYAEIARIREAIREATRPDGAYGIGNGETPGDTIDQAELIRWYRDHITAWTAAARPVTTLWVWNTEIGWAMLHPELDRHGWDYVQTIIWDKGESGEVPWDGAVFPVVTEVCAVYRSGWRSVLQTGLLPRRTAGPTPAVGRTCGRILPCEITSGSADRRRTPARRSHIRTRSCLT